MLAAALLAAAVLASPRAQAAPPRVSALVAQSAAPYQQAMAAFKRAWDGPVSTHVMEFEEDALARVKAERPQLVLAVGARAAKAAQTLTDLPVVYCMVLDAKANGVGAPNLVGVPLEIPARVQLAELKRLLPGARTVGLVFNPARSDAEVKGARIAADELALTLLAAPATSAAAFPEALRQLLPRAQALWLLADPTVVTADTFRLMLESAMAHRVPLVAFSDEFVRRGALLSLSPDFEAVGIEAARLARALSEGKKPSELTPAQPRFKLVVNLGTARALGVSLPQEALKEAVQVQ
jgi:putative ABC transport system substrate-binding protein